MGVVFPFEITRQPLDVGETTKALLLIDSPCPRTLTPFPVPTLMTGLSAGLDRPNKGIDEAARQYFDAGVRCLEHFTPRPAGWA